MDADVEHYYYYAPLICCAITFSLPHTFMPLPYEWQINQKDIIMILVSRPLRSSMKVYV